MIPASPGSTARPRYVKVAVNAGRPTYLTFSYSVPADRAIAPGEVVHAPWGARTLQGVVVEGPLVMKKKCLSKRKRAAAKKVLRLPDSDHAKAGVLKPG